MEGRQASGRYIPTEYFMLLFELSLIALAFYLYLRTVIEDILSSSANWKKNVLMPW